jgi:hypothetical protein
MELLLLYTDLKVEESSNAHGFVQRRWHSTTSTERVGILDLQLEASTSECTITHKHLSQYIHGHNAKSSKISDPNSIEKSDVIFIM